MSTNKRIPKRSIIGSRVSACCKDGLWRIGLVTAMRSKEDGLIQMEKKFSVRLESSKRVEEFSENEVMGPGFLSAIPLGTQLHMSQHVFVTHNGREVEGKVNRHDAAQVSYNICTFVIKQPHFHFHLRSQMFDHVNPNLSPPF